MYACVKRTMKYPAVVKNGEVYFSTTGMKLKDIFNEVSQRGKGQVLDEITHLWNIK